MLMRWFWRVLAVAGFAGAVWLVYALIIRGLLGIVSPEPVIPEFTDVPSEHPYRVTIEKVVVLGIMTGTSETTFGPEEAVTRGEMAEVVVKTMKWPLATGSVVEFDDVTDEAGADRADYIAVANAKGIMTGTADSPPKFMPESEVTLGQLIVVATRAGGEELTSPSGEDPVVEAVRASRAVKDALYVALANGLLDETGIDITTSDMGTPALREQVAQIMLNLRGALGN